MRLSAGEQDESDEQERDLLSSGDQLLVFYGLPFTALMLAGNFGDFLLATRVPAVALLMMSSVCFVNIARSGRVYCYFLAPWFLSIGIAMGTCSFRLFDPGSDTWSLIVTIGLAVGVCVSFHIESAWGKYAANFTQGKHKNR